MKRDSRAYEYYKPSRAHTRGVVVYLSPEAHAALSQLAAERGASLQALGVEALRELARTHGIAWPAEAPAQETARSA
jgi:predicted HicB family RNase H-like nuclease